MQLTIILAAIVTVVAAQKGKGKGGLSGLFGGLSMPPAWWVIAHLSVTWLLMQIIAPWSAWKHQPRLLSALAE